MNNKKFLIRFAIVTGSVLLCVLLINIYIDIYGLFLGRKDRKVYINERTSKYLLSFRYIPENYDGFIIGPSLSANLNPEAIKNYHVYNASIMGANISDLHFLINNLLEKGNMKLAIICLDPYLTKDFGKKNATIDPKEYWGALGSTNLAKTYFMYFVRKYNLLPSKYAPDIIDQNGWNNFELEMKNLDPQKIIGEKVKLRQNEITIIDPRAYDELNQVLLQLRSKGVKVVGYFSPVPYPIYSIGSAKYHTFQDQIKKLFTANDTVLDLNDEKYKEITSDYHTFIDHGHLSAQGQAFVLREITASLKSN